MEECRYEKQRVITEKEQGMLVMAFKMVLLFHCVKDGKFDPIFMMENVIPLFDGSFNYEIVEKNCWIYENSIPVFYDPRLNKIVIRSDVYEGALAGDFMDMIIITHEVLRVIQKLL